MLEILKEIEWNDYVEVLTYGTPPIYIQLLIFIGLYIVVYLYRTITRKRAMSKGNKTKYKILFFVGIALILFQEKYDFRGWMDIIGF